MKVVFMNNQYQIWSKLHVPYEFYKTDRFGNRRSNFVFIILRLLSEYYNIFQYAGLKINKRYRTIADYPRPKGYSDKGTMNQDT
jgi:hypothetical protein